MEEGQKTSDMGKRQAADHEQRHGDQDDDHQQGHGRQDRP
jgi:hypothetical protein